MGDETSETVTDTSVAEVEPQTPTETSVAVPAQRRPGGLSQRLAPTPLAPVDTAQSVRPAWMTDRESVKATASVWTKRNRYRAKRLAWNTPVVVVLLLVYSPRGLTRLIGKLSAYLYDFDSAQVRHHHAGKTETPEYVKAQNIRKANLKARWMVFGAGVTVVTAPVLAYVTPVTFSALVGFTVFVFVVKLIPGRSMGELFVGAGVGTAVGFVTVWGTTFLPVLNTWAWLVIGGLGVTAVLALGWLGRPARAMVPADGSMFGGEMEKPSAPLVIEALVSLKLKGLSDKEMEEEKIRVFHPGVARAPRGYMLELELPQGVTASAVMDKREEFAAALRRRLGCVWPSRGPNHPGHLRVFISDQPMADAPQPRWRVADGRELDIFAPMPMFTDQQGKWVDVTFAYNHFVIGGMPGFGKSFAVRQFGVAVAFDPRVMIVCLDGKGNGDLRPLRLVAHGFYEGDEEDEIDQQLRALRAIRQEMRRRNRFLRDLPVEENPQNKVTTALLDKYPALAPIVVLVDEVQTYTEHDDKKIKEEFVAIFTDLVKRGRSAGIIPIFCTQKPDKFALPSRIADNCTMRLCFKVHGWVSNNQVLGSEMHANGVKATLFSSEDKGIAYLRGDGADAQIVRTVHGLDQVKAEELCAIARELRKRRNLLTGYAAGEEAEAEEEQVDFLADCREAMGAANAMLLTELLPAIAHLNGHWAELDVSALSSMLKGAGVKRGTVWSPGLKTDGYGVKARWLEIAATSDLELDTGDGDGPNLVAVT